MADQAIPLRGGREFLVRSIIACHARGTPSAQLLAGLYTLPGKAGSRWCRSAAASRH
ncbi:hypothetical protein KXS07_24390 [Inquilinus limosus]|uniref:hypothetical protein n=1 Tax=Inquilinus limosus TaxID=171674 RepID=UPI003F144865